MHVSARRILFLLAVALVAARASTREPSATYQRAGHEGILLQAASRIGTSTEQIVERLGPDLDGRGEHYSSNGHASDPKAILYENITRLSVGPESSSATGTTGDHGARQSMMIRQLELEEEEVNRLSASSAVSGSDAAYDMDRAGTASIGRRQGETALAECSPSRCSFNVDSVGTLSRAEGKGCADPECQSLVLDQRGIKAIATDAFSGMVNLKILIITNNQLGTILHSHLKDLVALEELYLSYNHLTSISDGTFSGLSSLESLHLMYNAIDTVSAESFAGLSGLKRLKLGYQRPDPSLSSVYSMGGLKNIQDGSLRHMPLLEDLDLGRHGFTQLSNGIFSGGLSNLKFLNLQGSQVVELSTKVLRVEPHAFVELSGLESLDLSFSAVDGEALKPGLFRCCTKLNNLDLSGNPITTLTGSAFAGLGNGLEKLNLIICLLSSLSPRTFRGLSKLKTLYLMNNRLSVMPLEVFANLSETCTVGVSGNSLSCRPKTGKDVQPGSDTSYPATLYDSDHIAELDPSLRMCPAQVTLSFSSCPRLVGMICWYI